jgi:phage terminase large subunit
MTADDIVLSEPQRLFARSKFKYPAFVGGYGSGKTFAGALRTLSLKSQCVGQDVAYYMPTYGLVKDVAVPRFEEVLDAFKVRHTLIRSAPQEILIPDYKGRIIFRTLDQPEKIVGYEVAHSVADEIDTLAEDKAEAAWNKIIARNRAKCGMVNSVGVVTTPEGFRFVYNRWVKKATKSYRLYKAKTRDNVRNLPDDYISGLEETYPSNLLQAYLEGEFVNLTSGTVYTHYDRKRHRTDAYIQNGEALHIGMDFNVTNMAAVIHVIRNGKPYAVKEYVKVYDTPAMIDLIKSRHPGHTLFVYPDASGSARKSNNASVSDHALLKGAGFFMCVNPHNPAVKDRVLAMPKMFELGDYAINDDLCPAYAEGLEKQAYDKNGEPAKTGGFDHPVDAGGYFITHKFPILKRTATIHTLRM